MPNKKKRCKKSTSQEIFTFSVSFCNAKCLMYAIACIVAMFKPDIDLQNRNCKTRYRYNIKDI